VTEKDIENETRAIDKLAKGHVNVVAVLGHGPLGDPFRCYYFDMDLCDCTLETYIYGDREFLFDEQWHKNVVDVSVVPKDDFLCMRCFNIWTIMFELTQGLKFIHACKQVHRDLKPRNGTPYSI
jgi:serine/threonine protein kinase